MPYSAPYSVTRHDVVGDALARELWQLYLATFLPVQDRAASRHLLTEDEFRTETLDPRVVKYVTADAAGRVCAFATVTTDLSTLPWVEPLFFARRLPDHYAAGTVFYLGLALVHPSLQRTGVVSDLAGRVARDAAAAGGVVVSDMCAANMPFARSCDRVAGEVWGEYAFEILDTQSFMVWGPRG